jgi:protoporphyrinogen IX oxidase
VPWLKLLHITAVIVWCGALLYLPGVIAAVAGGASGALPVDTRRHLLRSLYTGLATPAALLAIGSGTLIIVVHEVMAVWLMAKLGVVGLLVLGHGACGLLVLRAERGQYRFTRPAAWAIVASTLLWLAAIAWLVLGKPQ